MTESELAKLVTSTENTPELGDYWANRYQKFLKDKSFIVNDKTIAILTGKIPVTSPATPFGHIDLAKFVSKNKSVDEIQLQSTIETAVRFLDSMLDIIEFSPEAKMVINQYRKIGVGVVNFREYLNMRVTSSEIDEIDYLGNIISSSAYRASEALAEEKGTCDNWDFIKMYIRPKAFEYWYNVNTGDIKNGLDISEEFTPDNIISSGYEIIPRRNSNIMLYPSELEWQIWSDRDETVAKIDPKKPEPVQTQQNAQVIADPEEENTHPLTALQNKLTSWFTPAPKIENIPQETQVEVAEVNNEVENEVEISGYQEPETSPLPSFNNSFNLTSATDEVEPTQNIPNIQPTKTYSATVLGIGDIVKVINPQSPIFGQYFQISDTDPDTNTYQINTGNYDQIICQESDLIEFSIKDIINEVSSKKTIKIQAIVLSTDGKYVLVEKNSQDQLPTTSYSFEQDPEQVLSEALTKEYSLEPEFLEISNVHFETGILNIIYQIRVKDWNETESKLEWQNIEEMQSEYTKSALEKSLAKIRRWQQSAKLKANKMFETLVEEDRANTRAEVENELKAYYEEKLQALESQKVSEENSEPALESIDEQKPEPTLAQVISEKTDEPSEVEPEINEPRPSLSELTQKIKINVTSSMDNNQPTDHNVFQPNTDDAQLDDKHTEAFAVTRNKLFQPTVEFDNTRIVSVIVDENTHEKKPQIAQDVVKEKSTIISTLMKLKKVQRR
jgi:Ribonucleotide reductase, barrel domain